MAAVHGPTAHPSPFRKPGNLRNPPRSAIGFHGPQQAAVQPHKNSDPYYGHEYISRLCARFITHLFACPEQPPNQNHPQTKLPYFIAYALHRTKLHVSVTFAALVLLQRLKARFPTARGSSGHRLFISAFMIASKVICDDTYSNKSWAIVAQQMFSLREINQMEREMCSYLEWELTVDNSVLSNFESLIKRDFRTAGPYPTYSLAVVTNKTTGERPAPGSVSPHNSSSSPIPSFGEGHSSSPPKPVYPVPSGSGAVPAPYATPPATPDTPSSSRSSTTSPASSGPATPAGVVDWSAKIASAESSPVLSIRNEKAPQVHPLKTKMFAYAMPAVW